FAIGNEIGFGWKRRVSNEPLFLEVSPHLVRIIRPLGADKAVNVWGSLGGRECFSPRCNSFPNGLCLIQAVPGDQEIQIIEFGRDSLRDELLKNLPSVV